MTDKGKWSNKKLPKTGGPFPLSKTKSVRLGDQWDTRFVKMSFDGHEYVLMIGLNQKKQEFAAYLGVRIGDNSLILARLEYHSTHPGVHIHSCCGTHEPGWVSRTGHPGLKRIPTKSSSPRNTKIPLLTQESALHLAATKFRIDGLGDDETNPFQGSLFEEQK